jgi:excisionase family DNA binding protein
MISTKEKAASFMDLDKQTVENLIKEGRIINYGRGRLFLFNKSELTDIRKTRNEDTRNA